MSSIGSNAYMRLDVEKNYPTTDDAGTRKNNWVWQKQIWARRATTATSEAPKGNQLVATQIEIFRIRNQSLDPAIYRLRDGDLIYDIRGIRTDTEDRQYMMIDCELSQDKTQ